MRQDGDTDDATLGDFVAGEGPLPDEQVEDSLRSQTLADALLSLPERHRNVVVLRYGLQDGAEDAGGDRPAARPDPGACPPDRGRSAEAPLDPPRDGEHRLQHVGVCPAGG